MRENAAIDAAQAQSLIGGAFRITPLAFLPVIMVFALSMRRVSGFISLMASAIFAVLLAAFTQPELVRSIAGDPTLNYAVATFKTGVQVFATGFHLNTGDPAVDRLFSGGGTFAMFETIWLILVAAAFGAIVEHSGMIQRLIAPVARWANNDAKLIFATGATTAGLNVFTADPYVSIVLAARMYRDGFMRQRLRPAILSSMIADSGSIISPLIPWNVHGAFIAGALGIGVLEYAPFAFFCFLTPLVTLGMAYLYFRRDKLPKETNPAESYGAEPDPLPQPQLSA